jgi:hypothetical protein
MPRLLDDERIPGTVTYFTVCFWAHTSPDLASESVELNLFIVGVYPDVIYLPLVPQNC